MPSGCPTRSLFPLTLMAGHRQELEAGAEEVEVEEEGKAEVEEGCLLEGVVLAWHEVEASV